MRRWKKVARKRGLRMGAGKVSDTLHVGRLGEPGVKANIVTLVPRSV